MEALANPYWNATTPGVRRVLQNLTGATALEPFYLAGGTALALRLGHRISVDLDFFGAIETFDADWRRRMIQDLSEHFATNVIQNSPLGLVLEMDGASVGFFTYGYSMLAPLHTLMGIPLAGIQDIGLMKLDAIADRGKRKDFIDLYFIAQRTSLEELLRKSKEKYPVARHFVTRSLEALIEFDVADSEANPEMLVYIEWEQVKEFCIDQSLRISRKWIAEN